MVEIVTLSENETARLLNWAQTEGWNPGIEDANAFYLTDPSGFLGLKIDNDLACAMSLVKHTEKFGFLGLYICHPRFRGKGLGFTLWQAALNGFDDVTIGLDGVVEQQANYRKSGFQYAWKNRRFKALAKHLLLLQPEFPDNLHVQQIGPSLIKKVIEYDEKIGGYSRPLFLQNWFRETKSRLTLVATHQNNVCGVVTIRQCIEDYKIGPLLADSANIAEALLQKAITKIGADRFYIDVPETNAVANNMLKELQCETVFETARMYRGKAPTCQFEKLFGVATLELG